MALLESCTDVEIYNCPNMSMFPQVITRMPKLISLNISNNIQWSQKDPEGLAQGLAALGNGPAKDELQILYCADNGVTAIPDSFRNLKKLGLLDMTNNKISKLPTTSSRNSPPPTGSSAPWRTWRRSRPPTTG